MGRLPEPSNHPEGAPGAGARVIRRSSWMACSRSISEPAAADEASHAVSMLPDRRASSRVFAARAAMRDAVMRVE